MYSALNASFLSDLSQAMSRHDIIPPHINIKSTKVERFSSLNICRKDCCYYMIFYNQIGAQFGCWRRDIHEPWFTNNRNYHQLTSAERESYRINRKKIEEEKNNRTLVAKIKCKLVWDKCTEASDIHPYLIKKKIKPLYCKQYGNNLVIPVFGYDGQLQALQYIQPDCFKLFETGSSYKNGFLPLGEKINHTIRLCEGYATGCSIYEAVGDFVVVCISANNLINVARWFRERYKNLKIIMCADDDLETEASTGKNTGLIAAIKAAEEINAQIIYPDFTNIPNSESKSDFNDLHCLAGIEAVENQLITSKELSR
jgi:putative DNA primase/helicase